MTGAELRKEIPQLTEKLLQYLGNMRYIPFSPIAGDESAVTRRGYSKDDIPFIRYVVHLVTNRDLTPRKAWQLAIKKFPAYKINLGK